MKSFDIDDSRIHQISVPTLYPVGPVNLFILERNGGLTLLDAGVDTDEAWELFQQSLTEIGYATDDIEQILLTHHHPDHIGLVNRIVRHHPIPVFIHRLGIPRIIKDKDYLFHHFNFLHAQYREMGCGELAERHMKRVKAQYEQFPVIKVEFVTIDEESHIPGWEGLVPVYTPGHAIDHLMFYDRAHKLLFAGDQLLPYMSSPAFLEHDPFGKRLASYPMYRESHKKCRALDVDLVFPGHGEVFEDHVSLVNAKLMKMDDKAVKIKKLMSSSPKTAFELANKMYPGEIERLFSPVMSEIIGVLDELEQAGQIQKEFKNNVAYYF